MEMEVEGETLRRAGRGDEQAVEEIFLRCYDNVRDLCARFTSDVSAADDLAQETFLRMLRFGGSFAGRSAVSTWIYRVARNVCADHNRRTRRRDRLAERYQSEARVATPPDDVSQYRLDRAIALLPDDQREALVLNRFHDLPYDQIARIVGCSAGTARVRVHRAIQRLRETLVPAAEDGLR